jgi:hypothetical protein
VPDAPTYEQLQQLVAELAARVVELERIVAEQADEIAELKRQSSADSSNSSRPPSSDAVLHPAACRVYAPTWSATNASSPVSSTTVPLRAIAEDFAAGKTGGLRMIDAVRKLGNRRHDASATAARPK